MGSTQSTTQAPMSSGRVPSRRSADIPVFQITAFDLNGCFVCNLMKHSHIGRARLPSSRGGPYHVRPASYTRPDPGAPRMGCRRFAGFQTCCSAGLQACRAVGRCGVRGDVARRSREENRLYGSIRPVALRGQAGYNLRGGSGMDRHGSAGASPYRCDCDSLVCRGINR